MSVTFTREDELDIGRGAMIVRENNLPAMSQDVTSMVCWLNDRPGDPKRRCTRRPARVKPASIRFPKRHVPALDQ